MPDIDHIWGNDISAGPTGDLAIVDGTQLGIERCIRRLMTRGTQSAGVNRDATVGEMIFHPTYGAGLPQRIGGALDLNLITSVIRSQILKEAAVAKSPPPVITLTPFLNGLTVLIQYNDAVTGLQNQLKFDATP